jgi:mono/diheme cytochrome c family protein
MDDFRKIIYGVLIGFVLMIVGWISFLAFTGCGFGLNCAAALPKVDRTSIPTLYPATLPIPTRLLNAAAAVTSNTTVPSSGTSSPAEGEVAIARPSNPGGAGAAINLTGDANSGKQIFATNCQTCHNTEGKGGIPNPGSTDGTVPPLNPIDPSLISADAKTYATNIDLFLEHGSTPEGVGPTFSMPAWGDKKALNPQQIADVIAYVVSLNPVTNPGATTAPTPLGGVDIARPSNPGGAGAAINLTGEVNSGKQIFASNCVTCHNTEGKGGIANPGSSDGTVPPLNPIDSTLISSDYKTYATNLDLFIEHGSTPEGPGPTFTMPPWGDKKTLTSQQIADVISYLISLNPASPTSSGAPTSAITGVATGATATGSPAAPSAGVTPSHTEPEPTEEAAHPSNPGGPGPAIDLTGDATSGQQIFATNCQTCHNAEGKGGVPNPGSSDGTVPALNPIDPTLKDPDLKTFATNLDLFIEHGSTPEGNNPTFSMPPWGDKKALNPQQIADVIAYLIGLNK